MTAILGWFISNPTVLTIIAAVVGALGWGWKQRRAGAEAERNKQRDDEMAARDLADEVQNDVGAMPPDAARKELGKWSK